MSTSTEPILQEANVIQRDIDELPSGQYVDFTITAEILPTVLDEQELTNYITTSSPLADPNTNNNADSTSITAFSTNRAISLSMIADDTSICVGQSNHVLITYTNIDTQSQILSVWLGKVAGLSINHFAPSPTNESSTTYQRPIGAIA